MKPALLFIINPISGSRRGSEAESAIKQSSLHETFDIEIVKTQYRMHAAELAKQAAGKKIYGVIAAGGDGTVNEVASSLVHSDTALGIVPVGSGNGLARHLKISRDIRKAIDQIQSANVERVDTLKINNRFALNVSGLGYDGYVAWLFDKEGKRGLSSYTRIGLREYFFYPSAEFELDIDNKKINATAHMVVIANASQFGNAAIISPKSDVKDGLMDVIIVKRPSVIKLPFTFFRLFNGTLKEDENIRMYQCKKLLVNCSRPLHLHIDGEPNEPVGNLSVELIPASLRIFSSAKQNN